MQYRAWTCVQSCIYDHVVSYPLFVWRNFVLCFHVTLAKQSVRQGKYCKTMGFGLMKASCEGGNLLSSSKFAGNFSSS